MSKNRKGTMGFNEEPGRSKRAQKGKLWINKDIVCPKCGNKKTFETETQEKCTKCKHIIKLK